MAVTIRTGGNGSYKTAYVAFFTILPALRAGRVVVTNLEGMEPLDVIEERFDEKFPSSAKLIRVFSRSENGIMLWQHFFCWCPINALIVIDECQDLFSKNIGFDMKKIKTKPLSEFLDILPTGYLDFFNSRHVPVNLDELKPSEVDDIGQAEYDEHGRIIYPLSFNEGFMRHRKYNWDIELLSPDFQQIDSSIKACAEQCFFQKNRDGFFFAKRKPYIFKHDLTDAKPKLPKGKDPRLLTVKIPIEAHLLYKSTGTGQVTKSGGMNVLLKNPMVWAYFLLAIFCIGYFIYGISRFFNNDDIEVKEAEYTQSSSSNNKETDLQAIEVDKVNSDVRNGRHSDTLLVNASSSYVPVAKVLYFDGIINAYLTTVHNRIKRSKNGSISVQTSLLFNVHTADGSVFSVNEKYLTAVNVKYKILDDCLVELESNGFKSIVTCSKLGSTLSGQDDFNNDSDLSITRSESIEDNSIFL